MKTTEHNPQIVIYQANDGKTIIEVNLKQETVWLKQDQIADLFGTKRPAITKHLNNIFYCGELLENSVCSILEHTASDGKVYRTKFYNLDAIISVGYRVNSKRATQFRIWATDILKDHIVNGITINEKRLRDRNYNRLKELEKALALIKNTINIINELSLHAMNFLNYGLMTIQHPNQALRLNDAIISTFKTSIRSTIHYQ